MYSLYIYKRTHSFYTLVNVQLHESEDVQKRWNLYIQIWYSAHALAPSKKMRSMCTKECIPRIH